jgi:beta-lactam-binding protein with PASTA domain
MSKTSNKSYNSKFLPLLPFICFFLTYISLNIYLKKHTFPLANITGCQLAQAVKICSTHKLRIEIIKSQEDLELPDGTVIHQIPAQNSPVKERQTVFVVITHKPINPTCPTFIGNSREEIDIACTQQRLKPIYHVLPYPYPDNRCFCQWPSPNKSLQSNTVICYLAGHEQEYVLWPNFKGSSLEETINRLKELGIKVSVNKLKSGQKAYIKDQQPKPGAAINLSRTDEFIAYFKAGT